MRKTVQSQRLLTFECERLTNYFDEAVRLAMKGIENHEDSRARERSMERRGSIDSENEEVETVSGIFK